MNILFALEHSEYGGVEVHLELLIKGLTSNGHKCYLACNCTTLFADAVIEEVYYVDFSSTIETYKSLRKIDFKLFDIVATHRWKAMATFIPYCKRLRIPYLSTIHSIYLPESRKDGGKYLEFPDFINKFEIKIIAVSMAVLESLKASGVFMGNIKYIQNAILPLENPNNPYISVNNRNIGFLGRLSHDKGVDILLDAFEEYCSKNNEKATLIVVGSGSLSETIYQRSKRLPSHAQIIQVGFQKNPLPFLRRCKFIVIPSRQEALSLVALEAMREGIPVIASNTGGLPELIKDKFNGILFPVEDSHYLANEISNLLADDAVCDLYHKNTFLQYDKIKIDYNEWIHKHEKLYKQSIASYQR